MLTVYLFRYIWSANNLPNRKISALTPLKDEPLKPTYARCMKRSHSSNSAWVSNAINAAGIAPANSKS